MSNITAESLYERVSGLGNVRNTPISSVVLNGNQIDVTGLPQLNYGTEGNVTVNDFMQFMEEQGDLASEFFGDIQANVSPDGQLTIQPQNMGTKGAFDTLAERLTSLLK